MKKVFIVSISFFCLAVFGHPSFGWEAGYNSNTGDTSLDTALGTMNRNAQGDVSVFLNDMSVTYETPKSKLEILLGKKKMEPADVYMALEVGKRTGRNLDEVLESYEKNRGKGWGAVAQEMGIKPGSKEFHALKGNAEKRAGKGKGKEWDGEKEKDKGQGKIDGEGDEEREKNKDKDKDKGKKKEKEEHGKSKGKGKK